MRRNDEKPYSIRLKVVYPGSEKDISFSSDTRRVQVIKLDATNTMLHYHKTLGTRVEVETEHGTAFLENHQGIGDVLGEKISLVYPFDMPLNKDSLRYAIWRTAEIAKSLEGHTFKWAYVDRMRYKFPISFSSDFIEVNLGHQGWNIKKRDVIDRFEHLARDIQSKAYLGGKFAYTNCDGELTLLFGTKPELDNEFREEEPFYRMLGFPNPVRFVESDEAATATSAGSLDELLRRLQPNLQMQKPFESPAISL